METQDTGNDTTKIAPTGSSLEQTYLAYLSAINSKDWTHVASFAKPTVVHNDKTYSNIEYARMIEETSGPFTGVQFIAEKLIVNESKGEIACRIRFEWQGETFWEHVFYDLAEGKIKRVWSVVDLPKK